MRRARTRYHARFLASLVVTLASCRTGEAMMPASSANPSGPHAGSSRPATTVAPRFVLWHAPARGIKSLVAVYVLQDSRLLEVHRTLGASFLTTWKRRLVGEDVERVDDILDGMIRAGSALQTCPKRHGRDGVVWAAMTLPGREEYTLDFHHQYGARVCDEFENYAVELMQLVSLKCHSIACLRPDEELTGTFECAVGRAGDSCREKRVPGPATTP